MHSVATSSTTPIAPPSSLLVRLREISLSVLLFLYIWLGPQRSFPPFVPAVPVALLGLFSCWWTWKAWRSERIARSPLSGPLVALAGASILATWLSVDQRLSLDGSLTTLALIVGFFVISDLLLAGWSADTLINILLLTVTLVLFDALNAIGNWFWLWYNLRVPEYPTVLVPLRIFGIADHPNLLVALINLAIPFVIIRLGLTRTMFARIGYGSWLLLAEIVMFFTRSRTGWVASLVGIAVAVGWLLSNRSERMGVFSLKTLRYTWRIWLTTAIYLLIFASIYLLNKEITTSTFSSNAGASHRLEGFTRAWDVFLQHPLTGSGPLTFGRISIDTSSATHYWIDPHPHSIYFDQLVQHGLLGFLAFTWLVIAGAWTLFNAWRRWFRTQLSALTEAQYHTMGIVVAASAVLLAYLVHGLLDVPHEFIGNAVLLMVVCAVGMTSAGAMHRSPKSLARWAALALIAPLGLLWVLLRQGAGQDAMLSALVQSMHGDWASAAQSMDEVRAVDPNFAFYSSQQGFAYGMLADPATGTGDHAALQKALAGYADARLLEPAYTVNLLNQEWLLRKAGYTQQADQTLKEAFDRGTDWSLTALLLGEQASQQGDEARAQLLFAIALKSNPEARDMAACRISSACRAMNDYMPEANTIIVLDQQARALIANGQYQQTLDLLQKIPLTDASPQPWLDRADAHLGLGQLREARYALQVATELRNVSPAGRAHATLTRAAIALRSGDQEQAIAALEATARPQLNEELYEYGVFWRLGLPGTFLPSLDRLQRTRDDLQIYRQLADLYTQAGRADDATWAQSQADALAKLLD